MPKPPSLFRTVEVPVGFSLTPFSQSVNGVRGVLFVVLVNGWPDIGVVASVLLPAELCFLL